MIFVNLTPFTVNLIGHEPLQPCDAPATCAPVYNTIAVSAGVSVNVLVFNTVYNLPKPQENVIYIVTDDVRMARSDRHDLASLLMPRYGGKTFDFIGYESLLVNGWQE